MNASIHGLFGAFSVRDVRQCLCFTFKNVLLDALRKFDGAGQKGSASFLGSQCSWVGSWGDGCLFRDATVHPVNSAFPIKLVLTALLSKCHSTFTPVISLIAIVI